MTRARDPKGEIRIAERTMPRGERTHVAVPVLTDLDGSEVALHIHAVVGAAPGPVLALLAAQHGSEWLSAEIVRRIVDTLDPKAMAGAVLAVPVANPVALATLTRNVRDESDSPDLNRAFGTEQAWIADQLALAVTTHVLSHADAVVDFHCGLWGAAMGSVTCGRDYKDPTVSERAFQMARAFGLPHIRRSDFATRFPGPRSAVGYAGQVLGIPGIASEVGGAGFDPELEEAWLQTNVRGVHGVLQYLGILPGQPPVPDRVMIFERVQRINPTCGGMLEPVFPPEDLMRREVPAGALLGRVWSPYTFEVLEELRAPFRGLVDMVGRHYPVRPGDWAYLMVDLDHPGTRWLGANEMP
ncbi:MAG: succinylglutamate desuccinylase/aspartoacylase family protein [Armatimonadota bacterium]|nr:succinylglutamate desuccinylase/aspartoacylase family protein [Armatimonadota bacterium]